MVVLFLLLTYLCFLSFRSDYLLLMKKKRKHYFDGYSKKKNKEISYRWEENEKQVIQKHSECYMLRMLF